MKGTQLAIACLFNLLAPSNAQPAPNAGPVNVPEQRSDGSPTLAHSVVTETTFVETSITAKRTSRSSTPITQTTTLSIIPTWTSNTIRSDFTSSDSTATTIPSVEAVSNASPAESPQAPTSGNGGDVSHRNLIIVLSTVLGSLTLILISLGTCLVVRYRKSKSPFSHRGASPIDDEEIASWRSPSYEHKQPILPAYPEPVQYASTIGVAHHHGWSWDSESPRQQQTSPKHAHKVSNSPSTIIPESPTSMARAPNSRTGLTDETKPGAEPYVATIKHQSSRLSKAPSHMRSKSRRSSISAKSVWSNHGHSTSNINLDFKPKERQGSYQLWYDPEDDSVGRELRNFDRSNHTNSPGTSVFDDTSAGGLSPRPASRPRFWESQAEDKEIGRAIA
ncbi:hypothetical protein GLAREA_12308 [Glarea lozoyensis ATCC 20868]|uniref:Mid2 domain-containing protein n=1 Tax=Glarea lozoyensis (strain ATCC 20868 / MF5171) TaxID=1116229 RepID=S3CZ44_GLAL2|nr:uncharacterized protein GLAREA_12308 [Glarea lozoyensis ATCC 20868]EPE31552.1 hypothetical protein GLAREA_12308 [Glarea lozoyensis ATCC 20868]